MITLTEKNEILAGIRDETLNLHFGTLSEYSETKRVAVSVFDSTLRYLRDNEEVVRYLDDEIIRSYFNDSCKFVKRLRAQLNPLGRGEEFPKSSALVETDDQLIAKFFGPPEEPASWIWFRDQFKSHASDYFSLNKLCDEGEQSRFYWPIPDLNGVCYDYLHKPGLQCKQVDGLIIKALIYRTLTKFVERLQYVVVPERTPVSSLFLGRRKRDALSKQFNSVEWGIALSNSTKTLISIALGIGASIQTVWWAGPLVWLATGSLFTAKQYFFHFETQKQGERLMGKLMEIRDLFEMSEANFVGPSYLKRRLQEAESQDLRFPPVIFAILDRAIGLNDAQWGIRIAYD
jgi:hypothetical protein